MEGIWVGVGYLRVGLGYPMGQGIEGVGYLGVGYLWWGRVFGGRVSVG